MADILNLPDCGEIVSTFNTGVDLCDVVKGVPIGIIFTDSGVEFGTSELADIATFVAAMETKSRAARGGRVYPMFDLTNYENQTQEATRGTIGNLSTVQIKLLDAIPGFSFAHNKGELFHKKLSKGERMSLRMFIIDDNYVVYGTKKSNDKFAGFTLTELSVDGSSFKLPTGTTVQYPFSVQLGSLLEYVANGAFVQTDSSITSVSGNIDVALTLKDHTANVVKVYVKTTGGTDMSTLYETELADVDAWIAEDVEGEVELAITSVAFDGVDAFTVTLDATAYGALTGGDTVEISLEPAADLAALDIDGYESDSLIITKA